MNLPLSISLALLSGTGMDGLPYRDASWAWALISAGLPPSLASFSMHPLEISPRLNYILTEELVPTYSLFLTSWERSARECSTQETQGLYFHARVAYIQSVFHSATWSSYVSQLEQRLPYVVSLTI